MNQDLHEALKMIIKLVGGGYRPSSIVAGLLSAKNKNIWLKKENIHVCKGNIWS